jgi:tetratricopeptide (TPR) repeat protein
MRASQELAHHHPNDVGRCFAEVASVCDRAGDQARARELYELALEYLERQSPSPVLAETLVAYAELAERVGDRDGAFDAYKRAATTRAELDATGITGATLAGRPVV